MMTESPFLTLLTQHRLQENCFQRGLTRYTQMENNKWGEKRSGLISTFVSLQETQYRFHAPRICPPPVEHDDQADVFGRLVEWVNECVLVRNRRGFCHIYINNVGQNALIIPSGPARLTAPSPFAVLSQGQTAQAAVLKHILMTALFQSTGFIIAQANLQTLRGISPESS